MQGIIKLFDKFGVELMVLSTVYMQITQIQKLNVYEHVHDYSMFMEICIYILENNYWCRFFPSNLDAFQENNENYDDNEWTFTSQYYQSRGRKTLLVQAFLLVAFFPPVLVSSY